MGLPVNVLAVFRPDFPSDLPGPAPVEEGFFCNGLVLTLAKSFCTLCLIFDASFCKSWDVLSPSPEAQPRPRFRGRLAGNG